AQSGGSAAGVLVAGLLATWAPAPRQLSFLLVLGLTVIAVPFVLAVPESAAAEPEPWRPPLPRRPGDSRAALCRASLYGAERWGSVVLYRSIVPSYARDPLHSHDLALLAAIAVVALACSCVALIVSQRLRPAVRVAEAVGLALLAVGMALLMAASPTRSLAVL